MPIALAVGDSVLLTSKPYLAQLPIEQNRYEEAEKTVSEGKKSGLGNETP